MDDYIVHFSTLESSYLFNQFKAQPTGHMGFRGFFVLIFVEALHGPLSFIIVDVRDCKMYLRNCHRPCLQEQAQIDLSCMRAVAIGLARVSNWPR